MAIAGGVVLGLGIAGVLSVLPAFQGAAPPLAISCGGLGLGLGLLAAALVRDA